MSGLTTEIRKNWFVIEEVVRDPDKIIEIFKPSEAELGVMLGDLENSVIEGIFEYKRNTIRAILRPLESLQYDSKAIELLPQQIKTARALMLVTLLQRLYFTGDLKPRGGKTAAAPSQEAAEGPKTGVKEILTYIRNAIDADPEKKKDPEVKKIIMYSKMYQNEIQKLNDILKTVPPGKAASVKENFKNSLTGIVQKMNTSYRNLAVPAEEVPKAIQKTGSILTRFDYSPLSGEIKKQAKIFSEVLTTMTFALNEKFNTREILVALYSRQKEILGLVDREQKLYPDIAPFDKEGIAAAKELVKEISNFLKKEKEWLKLHPW